MRKRYWIFGILLAAVSMLPAMVKEEYRLIEDPKLVKGQLENGLSYYILPNDLPENRAEMKLIVRAGSVQEREDQRGLAHMLEHMAFNGTEKYPENELVEYLQSLGMDFGPEVNAYTSFDETVYRLSVPSGTRDEWKEGLEVLKQWAFHINLKEEDIDAERPVIVEEWRKGRNAMMRMQEKAFPDMYKGSLYGRRLPIGTVESIQNFDYSSLRDFYNDWYRPELMSLIVVGDVNPVTAEALIREKFSGYTNPSDAPERTMVPIPSHEEDVFTLQSDPETTYSSMEIMVKKEGYKLRNALDYRKYIAEQLYLVMFNNRMAALMREGEAPFIDAYASVSNRMEAKDQLSLGVITGSDKLESGFRSFWREKERIDRFGFSQEEFQQAKKELQSSYEYLYGQRESLYSDNLVEMLQYSVIKKEPYPSLEWEWNTAMKILSEIESEDAMLQMDKWLEPGDRVFFTMEQTDAPRLTEEKIRSIINEISLERILPRAKEKDLGDLVPSVPQPGVLLSSHPLEEAPGLGIQVLEYANGARVYLKKTDFRENEILFKAFSPGGASLVADEDYISAALATLAVGQGGLGEFSLTDLERLLADKYISVSPNLEDYSESISGFSSPKDLETLLQLVYLNFTAPTYDENSWKAYESRLRPYLESKEKDPMEQYRRLMTRVLYDNHPRRAALTADSLDSMDYERAFRIFKERFLTGGDFQFLLVGNIDLDSVTPLISRWIGSLPPSDKPEEWVDRGVRFSRESHSESLAMGQEPLSVVTLVKTGAMDWSYDEAFRLESLTSALEDRLNEVIREKLGGTYSISVSAQTRDIPVEEYAVFIQYTCDPNRVEELEEAINAEILRFIEGDDLEIFARNVREAKLSGLEENLQSNRWWINELSFFLARDPESLSQWEQGPELIRSISADVLQQTAARYLSRDSALQEILLNPAEQE